VQPGQRPALARLVDGGFIAAFISADHDVWTINSAGDTSVLDTGCGPFYPTGSLAIAAGTNQTSQIDFDEGNQLIRIKSAQAP
jgi:hypothetical protein